MRCDRKGFDFGDFEITKREILASISIIAVMILFGILISSKISEHQMDKNEIYNKAVKIESQEMFQYGMDTNVGNAFVYGDLRAVDTVTYPEIAKMHTKAVIRAAINVQKAHADWTVEPEIMIPLVCDVKELKFVKKVVVETADAEIAAAGIDLKYEVGTMIEIPRAALTADEIATEADFFCFGTNDLTQMTYGFSRDDAGKFLNAYYDAKIFENDPFAKLDQTGVGKLMETAIKLGKPVNNKLHVGICGEHGGDPSSVEFCHKIGLDYVSCSPFRVPIARLAAAQAAIANK